MQRVIELIRVSRNTQALFPHFSIPTQRATNRRTARMFDLKIVRTIELINVSGAAVLKAPEMHTLLELICRPDIRGVVTCEFSRVMRPDWFSDYVLLQAFHDSNAILYLPEGPLDFGTRDGRFLGAIRAAIAGLQRGDLAERIWIAKEALRRAGKHPGPTITLPRGIGYDKTPSRWFYTPEAEKVREAFRLFLVHQRYRPVARELGIARTTLCRMLRNPIYRGWRVIDRRQDPSPSALKISADGRRLSRPLIMRAPEDIIRVKVFDKPLVDDETFNRVQKIMQSKKQRHQEAKSRREKTRLFQTFLRCNKCGGKLYRTNAVPYVYYFCRTRFVRKACNARCQRQDRLDREIEQFLGTRVTSAKFLNQIVDRQQLHDGHQSDRFRSLDPLEQRRQEALDSYVEGIQSRKEILFQLAMIRRQMEQSIEAVPAAPPGNHSAKELRRRLAALSDWKRFSSQQKKDILASLSCTIEVEDCRVFSISIGEHIIRL